MTTKTQDMIKTVVTIVGVVLTVVTIIVGVSFAAGNYPTREEWDESTAKQDKNLSDVKVDVAKMQLEQVRLSGSLTHIKESQARTEKVQSAINGKLDKALLQNARGRNRR